MGFDAVAQKALSLVSVKMTISTVVGNDGRGNGESVTGPAVLLASSVIITDLWGALRCVLGLFGSSRSCSANYCCDGTPHCRTFAHKQALRERHTHLLGVNKGF